MYPIKTKLIKHPLPVTYDNCLDLLNTSPNERLFYKKEGPCTHIGQVIARFIGIPHDEDAYYNKLYDYVHSHGLILLSDSSLKKSNALNHIKSIEKISRYINESNLSIKGLVTQLDEEKLLLTTDHFLINRQIREAAIKMFDLYSFNEKGCLENKEFVEVFNDVINWIFHLEHHLMDADPDVEMPAFIWYGNYRKSHQYLVYFLIELGCDLVTFTPAGNDPLSISEKDRLKTFYHIFPDTSDPEPFPAERRMQTTTVAFRASKEIEKILDHDGTVIYKPWQLREYISNSITLKSTYSELFLVATEKAMFRPNFELQNKTVRIPVLFAKINGIANNRREYWNRLHGLILQENSHLVKSLPFSPGANNDFRYHYQKSLDHGGLLNLEKMTSAHFWKYSHLPSGLQKGLASAIRNICAAPKLKLRNSEKEDDVKVYLFNQSMQIPESILKMLQKFDYSQHVPKLIIFNNQLNGTLTRPDAALLLLLNQFGIDIVIYNPAGQSDIENYIDQSSFVSHWLEEIEFEQELKEPSVLKKVFFQGISKILRRD
ncbi:YceG family protein [Mesobacillus selenatarsenatis]|uniref:Putative tellurium resistance protein n=1 Tax=Mesobacillus selenatarsenatis (strain DSM 18680 / JCM 14380 / FERM P-15431 / SF-1) TaxID=1321606 RepID=A0A0A8X5T4_MESS1|nr:YceG family protein [Mesobacillus selenatarsenatis]GAM15293.1 putative tellurium resistance protein [Mesobacillus selenatarsenatis SF-1]